MGVDVLPAVGSTTCEGTVTVIFAAFTMLVPLPWLPCALPEETDGHQGPLLVSKSRDILIQMRRNASNTIIPRLL